MKFVEPSQFADPDVAARKLVEIANEIGRATRCKKRLDIVALPQHLSCSFGGTALVTGHAGTSP